jgi:clan AA aspartic protease (TIGR02281 family)
MFSPKGPGSIFLFLWNKPSTVRHALAILILLTLQGVAHAEIYKFVDANGFVTYTNMPRPGGKLQMVIPDVSHDTDVPYVSIQAQKNTKNSVTLKLPMRERGGVYELKAVINDEIATFFVVDSGAAVVTLPMNTARILVENGTIGRFDVLGPVQLTTAAGTTLQGIKVRLKSLHIGGVTLHSLIAVLVEGDNVPSLLGQNALQMLDKWSLDRKNHTFVFTAHEHLH